MSEPERERTQPRVKIVPGKPHEVEEEINLWLTRDTVILEMTQSSNPDGTITLSLLYRYRDTSDPPGVYDLEQAYSWHPEPIVAFGG